MKRFLLLGSFAVLVGLSLFQTDALSQAESFRVSAERRSRQAEERGLAEAYKGITRDGTQEKGLFAIRKTGVSTEPVRLAAEKFLAALSPEERSKAIFPVEDPEWRKWMNQHFYQPQGVNLHDLHDAKREAGLALLRASLSAKGFELTRDIMRLNHTLGELNNNNFEEYGEWRYAISIFGEPSATEPWGWQLDGHHGIINYFVLGDQVVMTPFFVGSEPVVAEAGKFKGVIILQQEQNDGYAMLLALNPEQRRKAVIEVSKSGNNNLTEAFRDNVVLDYAGIPASELDAAQKKRLLSLIELFVGNMDDGHARVKMAEVEKHLDRTHFAWIGGDKPDSVFYYRIHSPVLLVEFDHQSPAGMRRLFPEDQRGVPFRQHIHVVVRTPNGNDYGKDLLRQHYEEHPHSD
jgi:hypothetical protein